MDALGSVQAEEFGLTEEKAEALYTDYWTAEKLVETITGDMNLEVSDSEAKVISVAQIQVSDRTRAEEIRSKIQEEGMDFFAAAKEYSEDPEIKKQLWYGLMGEEYEKTAFSMVSGEVSPVVEDGGKYYILRCENDYDERCHQSPQGADDTGKEKRCLLQLLPGVPGGTPPDRGRGAVAGAYGHWEPGCDGGFF